MIPYKTKYLGCDNNSEIAEAGKSVAVRFCWATMYSWATMVNTVSQAFAQAQLLHQEGAYNEPVRVAVFFTKEEHKKKEADPETINYRIEWLFENMMPPECGMIVSFYELPEGKEHIVVPFFISTYWPTKKQWKGDGDFITIQKTEAVGGPKKYQIFEEAPQYIEMVEEQATKYGYDIKYIDYTMPFDEMLDLLIHTKHHFTYAGATYYFCACTGTPVTAWTYFNQKMRLGTYYDYDTKERIDCMMQDAQWGKITSNKVRLLRWDWDRGVVLNKTDDYVHHLEDISELERIFYKRIENPRCKVA